MNISWLNRFCPLFEPFFYSYRNRYVSFPLSLAIGARHKSQAMAPERYLMSRQPVQIPRSESEHCTAFVGRARGGMQDGNRRSWKLENMFDINGGDWVKPKG
jgi:hypothetical protein